MLDLTEIRRRTEPLRLTILGCPVPKGRPRFGKGQTYTPDKTTAAERRIKIEALAAGWRPLDGRLDVTFWFYLPDHRRVDWDNLAKLACDALNGIAWRDDSQLVDVCVCKRGGDPLPRTEIEIVQIPEGE